jgi:hypothetical protein
MRPDRRASDASPCALSTTPEWNVAVFALLLNFPWEVLQAPLFAGMAESAHFKVIKACAQASLGDMLIMLIAYGAVSLTARSRRWVLAPSKAQLMLFTAIGLAITAAIEWLATRGQWIERWAYSQLMPVVPVVGIGLVPVVQWIVLPLLVLWFARRQLAGRAHCHDEGSRS